MKYLKQFIIGSSFLIFAPFFWLVDKNLTKKTYTYFDYTVTAPIYFGVWNVLSLIIAEYFGLTMRERFLVVTPLAALNIVLFAKLYKKYDFNKKEWLEYATLLYAMYLVLWNVIVYYLETAI
uniref:Uncharacterized protein n=1 Tax=viral metagenome TaxID=1070528 RepID=A0A6C0JG45_9ZZZZ